MTFRAVTFDLGGVLLAPPAPVLYRELEARWGFPEGRLLEVLISNPVQQRAMIGRATDEEADAEVARRLSLTPDELHTLGADLGKGRAWDVEMLAFVRALGPKYKTGVISNSFPGTRESVKQYVNNDIFDVIVFSDEEGVMKPDPEIYRRALSRLGVAAEETIFVDDLLPNVEGARALGIRAIHCTDSLQVREEINRLIHTRSPG